MGTSVTQQRIIGLTGGIATGKSTVSEYLATAHNLPILDADVYARQAVEKGSQILAAIAQRYGPNILLKEGTLNRSALGDIIFSDATEKTWVEQQNHPFVRAKFSQITSTFSPEQTLVYAIPLLFEANLTYLVTETWVVFCTPEQQEQRLMARNALTADAANSRINSQLDIREKCRQATHVINNTTTLDSLFAQVDRLLHRKQTLHPLFMPNGQ
mgnify:CR=1 FL=1